MSLAVRKCHFSLLVSVIAWDGVVTELFVFGGLPLCLPHTTHFSEFSCYGLSKTIRCAFINSSAIFLHNFKTGKLPPWVGLIVTERHSDLCLCFTVSEPGVAPSYKSTCHLRLKISYYPIQRPLCGKVACLVWVSLTAVSSILCISLIWWLLWCFCSQDESQSLKQTMCEWELHLCVQCNNARKVPVNMFSKL